MRVVVTGANRGIGLELCVQLQEQKYEVTGVCRAVSPELEALGCAVVSDIDVGSDDAVGIMAEQLGGRPIDLLINNAGIMVGDSLDSLDCAEAARQFQVNSLGPLRVSRALVADGSLRQGSKVALITSRMGSIADNDSGGAYGYRMSKAALNAAGVSLSVDLKPRGIAVTIIHPGWVRTDMTSFGGLMDTSESATGILRRIEELSLSTSGGFWHSNGERLEW